MQLTSGRLAAVAIGIPAMIAASAFGAFGLVGTFARTSEHHTASYAWQGDGEISVNTSAGNVRTEVGTGTQVVVSYTEHYQFKRPTVTATSLDGGLQLAARCAGGLYGSNCAINYVVTVPAAASLVLHTGDGDLQLSASTGSISANTGDGDINGTELISATVDASTGDGDIDLAWDVAPTKVGATTGNGDINLVVPPGTTYNVSAHTGNGGTHVGVPQDQSAPDSISADTGNGDIRISPAS
jgi:putative adhesin